MTMVIRVKAYRSLKSLSSIAKVYLVAPDRERSAVSHKITLTQPIRITRLDETSFITDASPADCVKAAFLNIVPEKSTCGERN